MRITSPIGSYVITSGDAVALARAACRGGARIVQYREKGAAPEVALGTARRLRVITRAGGALLVINDSLELALAVDADGVHLGQEDLPLAAARARVPPGFIIGVSTHSLAQALRASARGADYLGIGPVFPTPEKPGAAPLGIAEAARVAAAVALPVVAIGGIRVAAVPGVRRAGLRAVAMIRGFAEDTEARVGEVNRLLLG